MPATRCPHYHTQLQAQQKQSMVSISPPQPSNDKGKGRATPAAPSRGRGGRHHPRGPHMVISAGAQLSSSLCTPVQNQESAPTISDSFKWEKYPYLTDSLITWLLKHPVDWTILFYDKATDEALTGSKWSGNNKKAVNAKIAQHLFTGDPVYKDLYAAHISTEKFPNSVQPHLDMYGSCLFCLLY